MREDVNAGTCFDRWAGHGRHLGLQTLPLRETVWQALIGHFIRYTFLYESLNTEALIKR